MLGVVGIIVFAEMAGRVAAVVEARRRSTSSASGSARGSAFVNLGASFFITLLTLIAEIAGVALALQLATDVNYLLWIPLVGVRGVAGDLAGEVLDRWRRVVRAHGPGDDRGRRSRSWQLHPTGRTLWHQASHPSVPSGEGHPTYFYYAIALFGAAMTPYEVFFFSSGAVEENWTARRPRTEPRQRVPRLPARRAAVARR